MVNARAGAQDDKNNEYDGDGQTTDAFDRLSNDVSGFGKMPGESETDSLDDRSDMEYYNNLKSGHDRMATNGFDFYCNKIGDMMQNAMAAQRGRDVFSPPFQQTRKKEK